MKENINKKWIIREIMSHYNGIKLEMKHLKNNTILKKIIKNQRVLIVGAGPSANELKNIPDDVKILTCKGAIQIFRDKNIKNTIDIFLCHQNFINQPTCDGVTTIDSLLTLEVNLFITSDAKWGRTICPKVIEDPTSDNYYLEKLIKPYKISDISGKGYGKTSSGIKLLQYALFFGAKEIYLLGIDVEKVGYFWDPKIKTGGHLPIDLNFIELMYAKHKNIYSISSNSPITKYIEYKPLL